MTGYITGTSTRKVDDLVKALGYESGGVLLDGVEDLQGRSAISSSIPTNGRRV
jgi:hypothetical protein